MNLSYQSSLTRRLELIANNIANVNTTAFKAERVMFDDVNTGGRGKENISFVIDRASYTDFQSGSINRTGNQLDVAVVGEGWLSVETDQGTKYTRDGRMVINADQILTNVDGAPVLDSGGGQIRVPEQARDVTISKSGTVSVSLAGEPLPIEIARIGIFDFENPEQLIREESGRFTGEDANVFVSEEAGLQQFSLEGSNINPIKEIIKLMELSRAYSSVAESSNDIHKTKKDSIARLSKNQ
ncbi:flagellar basal-body rod protein FlgF [Parvularcula mediterranea]|uniref:flagellar basal-body rod protein FlgF n=1 Tax=Parvularcula mediterranea TaxID=2732508 RepID=UPI001566D874